MVTIRDVAKLAGVSIATVSRVLNNSSFVEETTRKQVLCAIGELNYKPNLLARNLKRGDAKLLLVLVPSTNNYVYNDLVSAIEEVARTNGYKILVYYINREPRIEKEGLSLLTNRVADGAISLGSFLDKDYIEELAENYNIVFCCENNNLCNVSFATIDNYQAAYDATKYLIEIGHKRIGLLTYSDADGASSSVIRENGYRRCLSDYGLDCREDFIKRVKLEIFDSLYTTKTLLENKFDRPSALICLADICAWGAVKAAHQLGINVPQELSIIGFDNLLVSSILTPSLTTISYPIFRLGESATKLLLQTINKEITNPKRIFIQHELILRDSTVGIP